MQTMDSSYREGWEAMTRRITQRPSDAKRMLTYFKDRSPQDSFDLGVKHAAEAAFGR